MICKIDTIVVFAAISFPCERSQFVSFPYIILEVVIIAAHDQSVNGNGENK